MHCRSNESPKVTLGVREEANTKKDDPGKGNTKKKDKTHCDDNYSHCYCDTHLKRNQKNMDYIWKGYSTSPCASSSLDISSYVNKVIQALSILTLWKVN